MLQGFSRSPCHVCILNFLCCMQTKRCPVSHIGKICDSCVCSARSQESIQPFSYRAGLPKPAQHNRRVCNYSCTLWLPSFCCSPFSGRCGKVSGVRVFAGSPCQMAVVKTLGGYLVGEIASKLVSQLMRQRRWCVRGCPKDQATGKTSQG